MRAPRHVSPSLAVVTFALALAGTGCSKDIPQLEELTPLSPASGDANAGNWRMIVLSGPSQFAVAHPAPTTSDGYRAELAAIKAAQASLTDAQRDSIQYWSAGGVLRWNQILRELVARYNLPPAPRDNGSYVFPDVNNPFADPAFPFSNPPYAARAYSYVAVAQFEALKVAWSYKYQYNRPAPSRVDSGIQALIPTGDLPAYPSEDAVLSGVSTELLRLLFPAAVEEIPTDVVNERPGPPPSTSSEQMRQEVAEVKRTVETLTGDQLAIAQRWNDGVSTYTPPGHWNDIATEYIRDARLSEVRAARAFALLNMAMHDAGVGCWDAKFYYFNPRPTQLDPSIKTVSGLPNFPAYTSGHSTFSAAASAVLAYLFPSGAAGFGAMRDEAGISRLYGGIHYPADIERGKEHGERIGGYTVRFARQDGAD